MKEFDAIKNIWLGQQEQNIAIDALLKKLKGSKNKLATKLLVEVIAMSVAIAGLSYAWYMVPFRMWTTHLSLLIFMASCLFVLFAQLSAYRGINNSIGLINKPSDYIQYLSTYQKERHRLNTQKYKVYTLFLGLGVLLFFVEIFFVSSVWLTIVGLGLSFGWILVCYFWLMRLYIKKEDAYLAEMIENLERLAAQFKAEEATS